MNKKILIIGGVGAAAVVAYFLYKKQQEGDSTNDATQARLATSEAANSLNSDLSSVVSARAVTGKSDEDVEYQNLLNELKRLNGGKLPSGAKEMTAEQLQIQINNIKALQDAINKYYDLEDDNIQKSAEQLKAEGYNTAENVLRLVKEVEARKTTEKLKLILDAFIANLNIPGEEYTKMGSAMGFVQKKIAWDEGNLQDLLDLSPEEKKQINLMFTATGGVPLPSHFGEKRSKWATYTTIPGAILNSNTCSDRPGAELAYKVKDAFKNIK